MARSGSEFRSIVSVVRSVGANLTGASNGCIIIPGHESTVGCYVSGTRSKSVVMLTNGNRRSCRRVGNIGCRVSRERVVTSVLGNGDWGLGRVGAMGGRNQGSGPSHFFVLLMDWVVVPPFAPAVYPIVGLTLSLREGATISTVSSNVPDVLDKISSLDSYAIYSSGPFVVSIVVAPKRVRLAHAPSEPASLTEPLMDPVAPTFSTLWYASRSTPAYPRVRLVLEVAPL